jgi:hypothetical protein
MTDPTKTKILDAIFAVQHLLEDARSPMPPEALGHNVRGCTPNLQIVIDLAVDHLSMMEEEEEGK